MNKQSEILKFNKAVVGYSDNVLIEDFSLALAEGELVGLMGLNGSGKTTLFKTILGQNPILSGSITINGIPIKETKLEEYISVVYTERTSIFGFTVEDMVEMGRMPHTNRFGKFSEKDEEIVSEVMNNLELNEIKNQEINKLSDGQFQKVMIGRALAQETPVLLLDEPTAYLDIRNKLMINELLRKITKEQNKTILISTHNIDFANKYCSKIWLINNREIQEKEPNSIKESDF